MPPAVPPQMSPHVPPPIPPQIPPCAPYGPPLPPTVPLPVGQTISPGPTPTPPVTVWIHQPDFLAPLAIRTVPDIDGPRTGQMLMPGDVFSVCEERESPAGIIYLRLADGRGWAFNRKPGVGNMCKRQSQPTQAPLTSGMLNRRCVPPSSQMVP